MRGNVYVVSRKNTSALARRIRAARIAAGFENAAAFARACKISGNTLYRYETGRLEPGLQAALRIADACGVTVEWLSKGKGPGPKEEPE